MVSLLADLDRLELSGAKFGDDVEALSFLGPSETRSFDYPSKGLGLDIEDARLAGFILALRPEAYLGPAAESNVREFQGQIRIGGRNLYAHQLTTERQFVSVWGEPFWRDEDPDEILLFFEFAEGEIQVELSLEGVPRVIVVTPQPLMADPEQRRSYGVTAQWSPSPREPAD